MMSNEQRHTGEMCSLGKTERHENSENTPEADAALRRSRRAGLRLLIAEDHAMNQTVVVALLRHLGYANVVVASHGRAAIDALTQSDFDAVLMDCQMPVMDGYEATRVIRDPASGVRNHSVAVIAMTAHALAGDRERCLGSGMNDYIAKPIQRDVLEHVLDRWTGSAPSKAPSAPEPAADPVNATFDRAGLIQRLMNNVLLAKRVAEVFARDTPNQLAALARALQDADADSVRLTAHSLKGSAATIGGVTVGQEAAAIEKLSAMGNLPAAEALFPLLASHTERLMEEIEEFCAPI